LTQIYNSRYCILILLFSNKPVVNKSFFPESFTEEIESWKKDKFFETSAVATILEEVRNKSFVVITGPSGIGKSTIAKLVALQLQKTKDYHILPVTSPKDIVKYFDPNIKQIYVIDDICGKFSVDQSMINSWERVECQILKCRKYNKEFRVLGTCRLEINISRPFRKLQEKYEIPECNLLQKKFLYSKEEKLKIAACHIDEETIKQLDDKILNEYDMFPLLCMMYATSISNPVVRFFEYPLQAIEEQLDEMSKHNECCIIGLALIVIYNNKLHKFLLQNRNDQKFEDVYNDVLEDLGLVHRPSKHSVLSGLQALEEVYVKELESTITVIHDKIFDIFALYFGKRIPKTILAHGSGTFIAERCLFESVEDYDDLKIVLPSELEHSYFKRMVEEIEDNRFYNVFKNVQVCNELYQRKFISFLSKHQSIIQKLLYNKWPLYLSAVNGCKLLVQFILNEKRTSRMCNKLDKDGNHQDMLKDKPESDMYACSYDTKVDKRTTEEDVYRIRFKNSPMVAACEGGYIDIVEYLVENGYNIDHSDTNLPTPLFSACQYGNKAVVDFLLKRNCKVDAINKNGRIALHTACENGNIDIVNSLLKCSSNMNLCDFCKVTPLYIACHNGHTDVVQILLDNNCDIHDDAIHVACEGGYKDIVEILIKHNVDIN
jgi:energy-coupling factor transporter ATP-binding protein EcfA2